MTGTRNRSADARILQLSEISTFDAWPWCSKNETHLHASQPRLFAEGLIATPDYLQVHIFIRVQFIVPFMVPVYRSGPCRIERVLADQRQTEARL